MNSQGAGEKPTLYGNARTARSVSANSVGITERWPVLIGILVTQRESSATIKAASAKYEQHSPAKAKNLIEIDCRGLEFTDFKPDVGCCDFAAIRS